MSAPLMPKATAVWLIDNTTLTFEQIADFCGLHHLEVQGVADEEVAVGIVGISPIESGELTMDEIERCQKDPADRLKMSKPELPVPVARTKGPRYTPVSKRQDRPDAIAWLLAHHPELSDAQISRLVGTTKPTIGAIRDRTHWNMPNVKPQNPVKLGLCTQTELMNDVEKANRAAARREKRAAAEKRKAAALGGGVEALESADTPAAEPEETPPALPNDWASRPGASEPAGEPAERVEENERTEENG